MKTFAMTFLAVGLLVSAASAQLVEDWQVLSGSTDDEQFLGMCSAGDGGFFAVGYTADGNGWDSGYLARFTANGTVMWTNTYSVVGFPMRLEDVCLHHNGTDIVATGIWGSENGESSLIAAHFDGSNGSLILDQTYTNGGFDEAGYAIEPTSDGGYILAGKSDDFGFTVKINGFLSQQWMTTNGNDTYQYFQDIKPTSDGGYIAGGVIWEGTDFIDADEFWVAKLNSTGNMVWEHRSGGWGNDEVNSVIETGNGSFIACGTRYDTQLGNDDHRLWAVRLSPGGNTQWTRYFGAATGQEYGTWVSAAPTGFYLGGYGLSGATNGWDSWLINIDGSGNMLWNEIYGGTGNQSAHAWADLGGGAVGAAGLAGPYILNGDQGWGMRLEEPENLIVNIDPIVPNLLIPAGGGSFQYTVEVQNLTGTPLTYDAWVQITYVLTMNSVEVRYWPNSNFPANQTVSATVNQYIPANAPAGEYSMSLFVGDHPWVVETWDSFRFTKAAAAVDAAAGVDMGVFDQPELWVSSGSFGEADVTESSIDALPSEFSLGAAYPNPFNPSTTLQVNLPQASELTVQVFDVTGRVVATLANGQHAAGQHTLTVDGSGLASGVYFIRANVPGELNAVRKVTLMK